MNSDRFMWIVIIGLAIGIGLIAFNAQHGEIAGIALGDFAQLVAYPAPSGWWSAPASSPPSPAGSARRCARSCCGR